MTEPVLAPIETTANRITDAVRNATLGHRIANPNSPDLDWVVLIYSRDERRWCVYRSNMDMKKLIHSLQAAIDLMLSHIRRKQK